MKAAAHASPEELVPVTEGAVWHQTAPVLPQAVDLSRSPNGSRLPQMTGSRLPFAALVLVRQRDS